MEGNGNNRPPSLKHAEKRKPCQQINCLHSSLALTWIWSRRHCKASSSFSQNKRMLGDLQTTGEAQSYKVPTCCDEQIPETAPPNWIFMYLAYNILFFSFSSITEITPQTGTTKCPLSLHDCCMATKGTTPARQLWEKFQILVPSPVKIPRGN